MDPEIKDWLEVFSECVRRVDYPGARSLFHPDVTGYGSLTDTARGIENLETLQWRKVWPHIDDFCFDLDEINCEVLSDAQTAFIHTRWHSTGYHSDGTSFVRPGRVTLLLTRKNRLMKWKAKHSHFSLDPGTPLVTRRPIPKACAAEVLSPA